MNPSFVPVLTCLRIAVRELHQVDLDILGRLPALRSLWLKVDNKNLGILQGLIVSPGSFPCLEFCHFFKFVWPVVFQKGAMPRLAWLGLWRLFYAREARGIGSSDGGLDLGLGNLPSLQDVKAMLRCEGASKEEAEQAKAALTHAAEMHPNHPRLHISIVYEGAVAPVLTPCFSHFPFLRNLIALVFPALCHPSSSCFFSRYSNISSPLYLFKP